MHQQSHCIAPARIDRRRAWQACRPAVLAAMIVLAWCALGAGNPACASPVMASSYSMPNGDGKTAGGAYNYWDGGYNGTGNTTGDGAALTGGLGALTDGVIATKGWNFVSNSAGTGQDVGWYGMKTPNPTITFTFAAGTSINEVDIYLDNTGVGGVFAPAAILIDGMNEVFTAPALGTVGEVAIRGLNLSGSSHTVQFDQIGATTWVMVSEVAFAKNVPEPGSTTLLGLGMVVAALARYRTRTRIGG